MNLSTGNLNVLSKVMGACTIVVGFISIIIDKHYPDFKFLVPIQILAVLLLIGTLVISSKYKKIKAEESKNGGE